MNISSSQSRSSVKCHACGAENVYGALRCEECSERLEYDIPRLEIGESRLLSRSVSDKLSQRHTPVQEDRTHFNVQPSAYDWDEAESEEDNDDDDDDWNMDGWGEEPITKAEDLVVEFESDAKTEQTMALRETSGSCVFKEGMYLVFKAGNAKPLVLCPLVREVMVIGRKTESPNPISIDLGPFNGRKKGVSRRHAAIQLNGNRIELVDLGSSNGTSINGCNIPPKERHEIRDGDVIRFGQLTVTVMYMNSK